MLKPGQTGAVDLAIHRGRPLVTGGEVVDDQRARRPQHLEWVGSLEKEPRGREPAQEPAGLGPRERKIAKQVLKEIRTRLGFLVDVGLDYLTVDRSATTLSGGEAQRVKLSSELSKIATGKTLYILDEPTTGLHFADIEKLLEVLQRLVDAGNTVLVIEHNLDVIKQADWIVDLGPEGGEAGGEIVATGTPEEIAGVEESYTGEFLRHVLPKAAVAAA